MKFIIIIPSALKAQAEVASKQIDPTSIGEDFITPLRIVGSVEPTHYANLPNVTDEEAIAAIRQFTSSADFAAAGGIVAECDASQSRQTFLALIAASGLEEIPPPPETSP